MKPICPEWEERLSLYVDGLLNPFDENAVAAHLSRCEACRTAVALWCEVGQSIRRLPRELPPAELRARILAETTRKPRLVQRLRLGWWQLAPALGMGLLLAYWTLPRSPEMSSLMANRSVPAYAPAPSNGSIVAESPALSDKSEHPTSPASAAENLSPGSEPRPPREHPEAVVIVVQPAPSPRWREPSPRWVVSSRAPAPLAAPVAPETALSAPREMALSVNPPTAPLPLTAVADLPVHTETSSAVSGEPTSPPTSSSDRPHANTSPSPSRETDALNRWLEQFNQQLQQENNLLHLKQVAHARNDTRFFVPILSWNIK